MISSPFSLAVADAMMQPNVNMALAADFDFISGISRVHSGVGDILINGFTYNGLGTLGDIGEVSEENSTTASKLTLTLSGIQTQQMSIALNELSVGRAVNTYVVVFDDHFKTLAYNLLFRGIITGSAVKVGAENAITYTVSNVLAEWSKGRPWRYTDESQLKRYPGDRIMRYVAQMSERSIFWGSKKDAPAFRYE